jgi:hypothetical protein
MYNHYRLKLAPAAIIETFADLKIKIQFSESRPILKLGMISKSPRSLQSLGLLTDHVKRRSRAA